VVAVVTVCSDFPLTTIVWTAFAIVYQQFENYVVQPRIQSRAAHPDSFVVIVAALFGGTLFGIVGALLAVAGAAAIQIAVREYLVYRRELHTAAMTYTPARVPIDGYVSPSSAAVAMACTRVSRVGTSTSTDVACAGQGPRIPYDSLIVATGSAQSYYGHDEFRAERARSRG
jgi:NADH dehydrogenase FAD-containing subunit